MHKYFVRYVFATSPKKQLPLLNCTYILSFGYCASVVVFVRCSLFRRFRYLVGLVVFTLFCGRCFVGNLAFLLSAFARCRDHVLYTRRISLGFEVFLQLQVITVEIMLMWGFNFCMSS